MHSATFALPTERPQNPPLMFWDPSVASGLGKSAVGTALSMFHLMPPPQRGAFPDHQHVHGGPQAQRTLPQLVGPDKTWRACVAAQTLGWTN